MLLFMPTSHTCLKCKRLYVIGCMVKRSDTEVCDECHEELVDTYDYSTDKYYCTCHNRVPKWYKEKQKAR